VNRSNRTRCSSRALRCGGSNQPLAAEQYKLGAQLYQQRWSLAQIGRESGKAHTGGRDVLIRAGVPRRMSEHAKRRLFDVGRLSVVSF
jgi:hypothetical protein